MTLFYCKKCGRQVGLFDWNEPVCDICNSKMYEIPRIYIDNFRWRDGDGKQAVTEELVKTSPEFDQYLFDNRDVILREKSIEYEKIKRVGKAVADGKKLTRQEILSGDIDDNSKPTVTCPYCHSNRTRKISTASKVMNTALFGVFGTKRHKQWHCDKCGSDF